MELWVKFGGFAAIRERAVYPISLFLVVCEFVFDREKPQTGVWAMVA